MKFLIIIKTFEQWKITRIFTWIIR